MAVVAHIADRVAVMLAGQIVETGACAQVFGNLQHPYTRRLIEAVPVPDPACLRSPASRTTAEVPSPAHPVGQVSVRQGLRDTGGGHRVAPVE